MKGIPSRYGGHLRLKFTVLILKAETEMLWHRCAWCRSMRILPVWEAYGITKSRYDAVLHTLFAVCIADSQHKEFLNSLHLRVQIEDDLLGRDPHRHIVHSSL